MGRRGRPSVQEEVTYALTLNDVIPHSRIPLPGLMLLIVYVINLLDYCQSTENLLHPSSDNLTTSTLPPFALTSDINEPSEKVDVAKIPNDAASSTPLSPPKSDKSAASDDSKLNDVVHKLGLRPKGTQQTTSESSTTTTEAPLPSTRRAIYIRGHLLRPPSSRETNTFHPPEVAARGLFQAPNSGHLHQVHNFRDDPNGEEGSRKKRKQNDEKERFHNYKLLYGANQVANEEGRKRTEFYAWIFGAAMLAVVSLTTVTSCVVFCFCGDKKKKQKKKRPLPPRRPHDTAGEYQRVESVSSIVDHAGENLDTIYEEQIDSVTII